MLYRYVQFRYIAPNAVKVHGSWSWNSVGTGTASYGSWSWSWAPSALILCHMAAGHSPQLSRHWHFATWQLVMILNSVAATSLGIVVSAATSSLRVGLIMCTDSILSVAFFPLHSFQLWNLSGWVFLCAQIAFFPLYSFRCILSDAFFALHSFRCILFVAFFPVIGLFECFLVFLAVKIVIFWFLFLKPPARYWWCVKPDVA